MKVFGVVYVVTNLVNDKKYVGVTTQKLKKRFNQHASCKKYPLGKAIQNFGRQNFTIEVLEECASKNELMCRERHFIAKLKTKVPNGYNLTDGGEGLVGCTNDTRKKISAIRPKRSVLCIETGTIFESLVAAAKWCNRNTKSIARACKSNGTSASYHWQYLSGSPLSEDTILKMKTIRPKTAVICVENGMKFESISEAASWCGGRSENISRACRGIKLTSSGFHWKYADKDFTPVEPKGRKTRAVYCIETAMIYESVKQAADMNNCETSGIIRACQNHNRSAAGYHRCYREDFDLIKENELVTPKIQKFVRCVETNEIFSSMRCAAKACGVDHSQISRACNGEHITAAGFHWEFV